MDTALVKQFLDSCHNAKRITELMPKLPKGMTPRHIHVIDAISEIGRNEAVVRVSDISEYFNVTRPSITKMVNELEDMGAVRKVPDPNDRRVVRVSLTELGRQYHDFYITKYHSWVAEQMDGMAPEHLRITIYTIDQVYRILSTRKMEEDQK